MGYPTFNQSPGEYEYSECGDSCCPPMMNNCLSCGMPMTKPEDFGGGNPENTYCVHCTSPDGNLKSYDEVLEGMTTFMMNSRNMDRETAESAARDYMAMMPAWSTH